MSLLNRIKKLESKRPAVTEPNIYGLSASEFGLSASEFAALSFDELLDLKCGHPESSVHFFREDPPRGYEPRDTITRIHCYNCGRHGTLINDDGSLVAFPPPEGTSKRFDNTLNEDVWRKLWRDDWRWGEYIEKQSLIDSIRDYKSNTFVRFLAHLFEREQDMFELALERYFIGTASGGRAIFWQVDREGRIYTGRTIGFNERTGRIVGTTGWIHTELKRAGKLPVEFEAQRCVFGDHRFAAEPNAPASFAEHEPDAVLASMLQIDHANYISCGSAAALNVDTLERYKAPEHTRLYPNSASFAAWMRLAEIAREKGLRVEVSAMVEELRQLSDAGREFTLSDALAGDQFAWNRTKRRTDGIAPAIDIDRAEQKARRHAEEVL